jgi:sugar/nucleoside kinase (ribokinase family)
LLQGGSLAESLAWGAAVAALKCGGWGGRAALPDAAAVARLLADGPRRALAIPDR